MGPDGVVQRPLGTGARLEGARRGQQRGPIAPEESHPSIVPAQRTAADPDHLTGGPELIKEAWGVVAHPAGQHVPLQDRGRNRIALQLGDDLQHPLQT